MIPVIDVHSHLFNAMDIPLRGYLESREPISILEKWFGWILKPMLARCIRRKLDPKKTNWFLKQICKVVKAISFGALGPHYKAWAETLSVDNKLIACENVDTFGDIDLYIPLMIDYEYWFKNTPDNGIDNQVKKIFEDIVLKYNGRMHPFVPFDPARELSFRKQMKNPDGCKENISSLKLVKDAIERMGFIGVKLYNALGYRPLNNSLVETNRKKIPMHGDRDKQGYNAFTGDEYDEVLNELYEYCNDNEVPITVHCLMGGIESYLGASFDFGTAAFWSEVLDKYPGLHLNLAHFGWNQYQGYHGTDSWVKDICEMFERYDHLYADVAHHRVFQEKYRRQFIVDYKDMCRDHKILKDRVLFGTDWHIIKREENYKNFRECYIEVLQHAGLFSDVETANFLGGNAMKFLGLLPGRKNRIRLEDFYATNDIDLPGWFLTTL